MSQFKYTIETNDREFEVMVGWDRPLNMFFADIYDLEKSADEPIWSSMTELGLAYVCDVKMFLHKLGHVISDTCNVGVPFPLDLPELLNRREGNVTYTRSARDDGWIRVEF